MTLKIDINDNSKNKGKENTLIVYTRRANDARYLFMLLNQYLFRTVTLRIGRLDIVKRRSCLQ